MLNYTTTRADQKQRQDKNYKVKKNVLGSK